MTDNTAPYTSEFVCNNLARKVVQGLDAVATTNAHQFTNDLLIPIAQRLSHGKMMRGALKGLLDRTMTKLRASPNVVSLELEAMQSSKLSSKEEFRLVFVITSAAINSEDWVTFIATEVLVSRKELSVTSTNTDFRIHRHALAKYMYRELKPTDRMMGDLSEAVEASALIGTAALGTENGHVAIPMKDGMLFGRVRMVNNAKSPGQRMRFKFNKSNPQIQEEDRLTFFDEGRAVVEIMTYVDWNSLTPARERLHAVTAQFMRDHAKGIRCCFDASYYDSTVVHQEAGEDGEAILRSAMRQAMMASKELIETSEWKSFQTNVGAHG